MTVAGPRRRRASRGSGEQLRAEIVTATKALLAESADTDAVSIRAVADAVGVTSPSIYLHFADKDALLEAVVADVFAELDVAIMQAAEGIEAPMQRLCAMGLAYIDFAVRHPEHYRVATMDRCAAGDGVPGALDMVLNESAFSHMRGTVEACIAAGLFAEQDAMPVALHMWAAAHGVAALMVSKPYLPWGDKAQFAYSALRAAALGFAVNDAAGGAVTPDDVTSILDRLR